MILAVTLLLGFYEAAVAPFAISYEHLQRVTSGALLWFDGD